eukprot:IDg7728t1
MFNSDAARLRVERDASASTAVVTTVWRFCEVFGKEEAIVERERSRSNRVKYFKALFRKQNYSSRNKRMHSAKQAEYFELDAAEKKSFFRYWHQLQLT